MRTGRGRRRLARRRRTCERPPESGPTLESVSSQAISLVAARREHVRNPPASNRRPGISARLRSAAAPKRSPRDVHAVNVDRDERRPLLGDLARERQEAAPARDSSALRPAHGRETSWGGLDAQLVPPRRLVEHLSPRLGVCEPRDEPPGRLERVEQRREARGPERDVRGEGMRGRVAREDVPDADERAGTSALRAGTEAGEVGSDAHARGEGSVGEQRALDLVESGDAACQPARGSGEWPEDSLDVLRGQGGRDEVTTRGGAGGVEHGD